VQRDSGNDEDSYPVLLLDDVITTGATITEAAKVLSTKYKTIVVIALAYQPLD
jgi:predicted amidophosphoribosyltransferase